MGHLKTCQKWTSGNFFGIKVLLNSPKDKICAKTIFKPLNSHDSIISTIRHSIVFCKTTKIKIIVTSFSTFQDLTSI